MGFKVDYTALDALYNNINSQSNTWRGELEGVSGSAVVLSASEHMSGLGADSVKAYIETVHCALIASLSELIELHDSACFLYKHDYQQNIDKSLNAVIVEDELSEIRDTLRRNNDRATDIYDEVVYSLDQIRDIFSVSFRNVSGVDEAHQDIDAFSSRLEADVKALESRHTAADFTETGDMIHALHGFISDMQSKGRAYKSNFSPHDLASSKHYANLYAAHLALQAKQQAMSSSMGEAIKNEEERIKLQQKELAEREKKANTWRWIVTGVCIVGSVAAIALTGGAATPLVIGAISAASGAVIAGTNNLADQYIANGDLSRTDWNSFGKDVFVGGVTGFVTGYAGAAVSGAITTGLGNTAIGGQLLNSSNALTRIGTGAVIGSTSQIGSGVVSRGAGAVVKGALEGDLDGDAVLDEMFDGQRILTDAITGGVSGGIKSAGSSPVGREMSKDDFTKEVMETKPSHSPNPEKWVDNGGKVFVDGNGTWTYQDADGITVCYADGYPDFDRAGVINEKADIGGFSNDRQADFRAANKIAPKSPTDTWHHSQDGHTLEAIPTEIHDRFRHVGGFSLVNGGNK